MKRSGQHALKFESWGGARKGAGRKRVQARPRVPHRRRVQLSARYPVHITLRREAGLESLRRRRAYAVVRAALAAGASRHGMRLVQFSVMTNYLHLVCEAHDERALARRIQGLCIRIARTLNRF